MWLSRSAPFLRSVLHGPEGLPIERRHQETERMSLLKPMSRERRVHRGFLAALARAVYVAAAAGAFLTWLAGAALAQHRNEDTAPFQDGVVLLRFNHNIHTARQNAILKVLGASELKTLGVGVHLVKVQPGHVLAAIQLLKARREIQYAEPDYLQELDAVTLPNDAYIGILWAAQNTGQSVNGFSGTAGADERTAAAWGISTGTNAVVVATLDTGIQYSHPDLLTNIWNNPGGINGCPAGTHGYDVLTSTAIPWTFILLTADTADSANHRRQQMLLASLQSIGLPLSWL